MNRLFALSVVAFSTLSAAPAFADAVTYRGVWGEEQVVVELTEVKDGPVVGRYSLLTVGADVPLRALQQDKQSLLLTEELPCTPDICVQPDDGLFANAPLGAHWDLHFSDDGQSLSGIVGADATSPGIPVALDRVGSRDYERQKTFAYQSFIWKDYNGEPIAADTAPYEYAKMQVALTEGPVLPLSGGTYRNVIDPRTKFAFPRIVSLPGGGDTTAINRALDQQRWETNYMGFDCLSSEHLSAGWQSPDPEGFNPLGSVDEEGISIVYLSDTVVTISQGGSIWCHEASPYNHSNSYTYDVHTGDALDLSHIFKGWTTDGPSPELVAWLRDAHVKSPDYDAQFDIGCEVSANIAEHLVISFGQDAEAVFEIGDIGQAACSGPFLWRPLADIPELLADDAAQYFPSLKR